ncbi:MULTISPECIES: F0F1 ATP synthase subunit delta [unclassified Thioalkalivibrio]|uniref:F0F1 ATP synthase subunit delta n=1 Tax=unclassified Thioalkalivibrio TaxID=2621013 RepID=UPI00037B7DD5|nr:MULTISPECIES: F0F1 ATP synthase subunit delta [unclassified Thioalkalivibrio]
MSDLISVARPYARAAFERAQEKNDLAGWAEQLELLAAIAADPQMHSLLSNPRLPRADRAQLVLDVAGDKVGPEAGNLVRLLAENGRLPALPAVYDAFSAMKAEAEKRVHADVIAFRKLTQAQEKEIHDALAKGLGCEVDLECSVDSSLLGGAIIRAGDLVIDGSVRGQLNRLAANLSR